MTSATYTAKREGLTQYFDATALDAWAKLTSDAPVSRIRATVRAGRDAMRATLLGWLPQDLTGARLLDAGCGTGALAVEAARRGARVTAIDVSPQLVRLAAERAPANLAAQLDWRVGDMADPALGTFDHVVSMDVLIHYRAPDIAAVVAALAARTHASIAFTYAPRTPLLLAMQAAGKLFPRRDRSPAIVPVSAAQLARRLPAVPGWRAARDARVDVGFYKSHALELVRA